MSARDDAVLKPSHRVWPHTEAIKAMVARGLGISLLPESAFQNTWRDDGLKTFPIPRKDLNRTLALVYPRPRVLRPAAVALIELLQEHFKNMPERSK